MKFNDCKIILVIMLLACFIAAGCSEPVEVRINHYLESPSSVRQLRRVVLIEMASDTKNPGIPRDMSFSLLKSIQARGLFHLTILQLGDSRREGLNLESNKPLSMEDITAIRKSLQCDAIILGKIIDIEFFPHSQITLQLSLIDLRKARAIWGLDNSWNSRDKSIVARMKAYSKARIANGDAPVDVEMIKMSSKLFNQFVAYETAMILDKPHVKPIKNNKSFDYDEFLPRNN